jgi:release factor glutamine methyltransferase
LLKTPKSPFLIEATLTRAQALAALTKRLDAIGIDTAADDARLLFQAATGLSRLEFVTCPEALMAPDHLETLEAFAIRRMRDEPTSRIIGHRGFWSIDLLVAKEVLDPRPDTEVVIEATLAVARNRRSETLSILDLGSGSGAISCALLSELPNAQVLAVDLSHAACLATAANLSRCGYLHRAKVIRGNWADAINGRFDIIVSNPPYIRSNDIEGLDPAVRNYDPALALDGGCDGLSSHREIILALPRLAGQGCVVVFEVGVDQAMAVAGLLDTQNFKLLEIRHDLGGHPRAVAATRITSN